MPAPPEPPRPDAGAPQGEAVAAARQPLFSVDSPGERIAIAAMTLVMVAAFLPWGGPEMASWGPLALSAAALPALVLAFLATMQVASTAGKASNVVMVGLASVVCLGTVAARIADNLVAQQGIGAGPALAVLGALVGLVGMELQRREGGLDYVAMATRALELVLEPRVQKALLKLFVPFALVGLLVFFVLEVFGDAVANKLGVIFITYFFNPIGKEVAIPLALCRPMAVCDTLPPALDPALTWSFIVFIDVVTALFLVWNYDHVLKMPFIGRFLAWVERRGNAAVVKHKWIRRLAFFGLTLYATLPLEGTGAIGGSVVGRAIGLAPLRTFLAVGCGSVIRTTATTLIVLGVFHVAGV